MSTNRPCFTCLISCSIIGSSGGLTKSSAELIASNAGLGYLIQEARLNFHTPRIFVGIIAIGILGYVLSKTLLELERWIVPWKSK